MGDHENSFGDMPKRDRYKEQGHNIRVYCNMWSVDRRPKFGLKKYSYYPNVAIKYRNVKNNFLRALKGISAHKRQKCYTPLTNVYHFLPKVFLLNVFFLAHKQSWLAFFGRLDADMSGLQEIVI
jgi:hypothetical protein